jgi:hypothetical protein
MAISSGTPELTPERAKVGGSSACAPTWTDEATAGVYRPTCVAGQWGRAKCLITTISRPASGRSCSGRCHWVTVRCPRQYDELMRRAGGHLEPRRAAVAGGTSADRAGDPQARAHRRSAVCAGRDPVARLKKRRAGCVASPCPASSNPKGPRRSPRPTMIVAVLASGQSDGAGSSALERRERVLQAR